MSQYCMLHWVWMSVLQQIIEVMIVVAQKRKDQIEVETFGFNPLPFFPFCWLVKRHKPWTKMIEKVM